MQKCSFQYGLNPYEITVFRTKKDLDFFQWLFYNLVVQKKL